MIWDILHDPCRRIISVACPVSPCPFATWRVSSVADTRHVSEWWFLWAGGVDQVDSFLFPMFFLPLLEKGTMDDPY